MLQKNIFTRLLKKILIGKYFSYSQNMNLVEVSAKTGKKWRKIHRYFDMTRSVFMNHIKNGAEKQENSTCRFIILQPIY